MLLLLIVIESDIGADILGESVLHSLNDPYDGVTVVVIDTLELVD